MATKRKYADEREYNYTSENSKKSTIEQQNAARFTVAMYAFDADDARLLLAMIGLDQDENNQ